SVSGAVITGLSEGECWIGATYTTGGKTYVSGRTKIKVNAVVVPPPVADPLVIAWAQEPAYVAQRGLITARRGKGPPEPCKAGIQMRLTGRRPGTVDQAMRSINF
ncbi:MAG: hypothetical protein IIT57_07800, partial [Treponema sp.]|nr:hypothetical protein [Treponema sp.]